MTVRTLMKGRRAAFPVGIGFGLVLASIAAIRGDVALAAYFVGLFSAFGALLAFSPSEWAISQSGEADERQRALNDEAVRIAYMAVITVAIVGFGVEVWRGDAGPFTLVGAVGGFTHMAALAVLRRRK